MYPPPSLANIVVLLADCGYLQLLTNTWESVIDDHDSSKTLGISGGFDGFEGTSILWLKLAGYSFCLGTQLLNKFLLIFVILEKCLFLWRPHQSENTDRTSLMITLATAAPQADTLMPLTMPLTSAPTPSTSLAALSWEAPHVG